MLNGLDALRLSLHLRYLLALAANLDSTDGLERRESYDISNDCSSPCTRVTSLDLCSSSGSKCICNVFNLAGSMVGNCGNYIATINGTLVNWVGELASTCCTRTAPATTAVSASTSMFVTTTGDKSVAEIGHQSTFESLLVTLTTPAFTLISFSSTIGTISDTSASAPTTYITTSGSLPTRLSHWEIEEIVGGFVGLLAISALFIFLMNPVIQKTADGTIEKQSGQGSFGSFVQSRNLMSRELCYDINSEHIA